jgi:hypothetical protein
LTGTVSHEGIPQEVEDRALLLATGFHHGEDALDKATPVIGLRPCEERRQITE